MCPEGCQRVAAGVWQLTFLNHLLIKKLNNFKEDVFMIDRQQQQQLEKSENSSHNVLIFKN